jgi:hypothetical protein
MPTTVCTFDETPPRRPGEDDFDGFDKVDDAAYPPNPVTDPTAKGWVQGAQLVQRLAGLVPHTSLSMTTDVGLSASVVTHCSSLIASVTTSTFTATPDGFGSYVDVTWPAGTFPTAVRPPQAIPIGQPSDDDPVVSAEAITNGVRVWMQNGAGSTLGSNCNIDIF